MAIVRLMFLVLSLTLGIPRDCVGQRYAILAPRTVRPHTIYDLVVTNLAAQKQEFLCEIVNSNEVVVGTSLVTVNPNELHKVQIRLEGLEERSYKLKVRENQQKTLINSTELELIDRSYLVLFQTDKPAYKPGDEVQFRVIFLFPNAYPVMNAKPTIFITDPEKVRMKQWINASLTNGVFEGSFQLAEYTMFGLWTISASLNQQDYKESFSVEEYTLPLFKIQVLSVPNPYFRCDDTTMYLKLGAFFVHGGAVRGNATVVVRANYNNYLSQTKEVARQEFPFIGMANVSFPTSVVANNCVEERNVWFDVKVTESSTGISYDTTSSFTVRNNGGVTMEVVDGNDAFYPGYPMWLKVLVSTLDEKPLKNENITIEYTKQNVENINMGAPNRYRWTSRTQTMRTNFNGIVRFPIDTALTTVEVNVEGTYNNQKFPLVNAYPMYEDMNVEYLVMQTRQAYHSVAQDISVDLYSNVKIKRIYYIGYCSGTVCESGVQASPAPDNKHELILTGKHAMKPRMKLLAFAVKEDGQILSSSLIIRIRLTSKSTLNVMGPMKSNNTNSMFSIAVENDAFVGLLGVDERVMRRSTSNDITQHKLENAMLAQEDGSNAMWSTYDNFGNVGVTLLTDGYIPDVGFVLHSFGEIDRAGQTSGLDYSIREDFPETWIWESLKPPNGTATIEKSLPDTITTWVLNGFSVSPVNGLQILKKPLLIQSRKRIFAQLYMPPSMKRLEEVTIHCFVHNYGDARNVSLEVPPSLRPTPLFLEKGGTENVQVKLKSDKVGTQTVKVILRAPNGTVIDALKQTIPVRPEGLVKTVEDVRILDFPTQTTLKFNLTLPVIEEGLAVSDGVVALSVIGKFLNLNSFNLEQMVQSSHGNGEENLLFLQTTMAVYEYLQKTKDLQPRMKDRLLSYMEVAYQQLLRYRLDDGSYSMFGSLNECGGEWFTASTVESLHQLSKYIPVDMSLLTAALKWLESQSTEDGSFVESCAIAHPHIQRTGGKELSLASSVLFAFVKSGQVENYQQLVNNTVSLLLREPIEDVYLMAKTTYLLTLMNHPASATMLQTLNKRAVTDVKYRYWKVLKREPPSSANNRDQETTAYALLANIKQNTIDPLDRLRVVQWLQKHSFAGDDYVPSLERILALEALGKVADQIASTVPNMRIEVVNLKFGMEVNSTTERLLQKFILPREIRSVRVSAIGSGLVLLKLSYRYTLSNDSVSSETRSNNIATGGPIVNIEKNARENHKLVSTFCFFVNQPLYNYASYLWKVLIYLPTGFAIDERQQRYHNSTKSAILLENNSHLEVVWDCQHGTKVCHTIRANSYLRFVGNPMGTIFVSSFDTKDVIAVIPF